MVLSARTKYDKREQRAGNGYMLSNWIAISFGYIKTTPRSELSSGITSIGGRDAKVEDRCLFDHMGAWIRHASNNAFRCFMGRWYIHDTTVMTGEDLCEYGS